MPSTPAITRTISNPSLVRQILSYAGLPTLATCLRTSSYIFRIAGPIMYRNLEITLGTLLGPILTGLLQREERAIRFLKGRRNTMKGLLREVKCLSILVDVVLTPTDARRFSTKCPSELRSVPVIHYHLDNIRFDDGTIYTSFFPLHRDMFVSPHVVLHMTGGFYDITIPEPLPNPYLQRPVARNVSMIIDYTESPLIDYPSMIRHLDPRGNFRIIWGFVPTRGRLETLERLEEHCHPLHRDKLREPTDGGTHIEDLIETIVDIIAARQSRKLDFYFLDDWHAEDQRGEIDVAVYQGRHMKDIIKGQLGRRNVTTSTEIGFFGRKEYLAGDFDDLEEGDLERFRLLEEIPHEEKVIRSDQQYLLGGWTVYGPQAEA